MSTILGLMGTEATDSFRFKNTRRAVFYDYPNGKAPLTGLTSMMTEESTNDPEFNWWEKRLKEQRTTTASLNAAGPFGTTSDVDKTVAGFNIAAADAMHIKVASTAQFRIGHIVEARNVPNGAASSNFRGVRFRVVAITSSTILSVTAIEAYTSVSNDTDANSLNLYVIGSAFGQGAVGSSTNVYNTPVNPVNYCQIFRTAWSITGTQLKSSLKYDETGPYRDQAKEASINHMIEMEKAFIWGSRTKNVDGTTNLPTYTTGGILWNMEQWEAGTLYEVTASTQDSDDNKRIITNSGGTLSDKTYNMYLERLFRVTNNKANEKLVLCGNGFLSVVNQMYKSQGVLNASMPMTETYGMDVVKHRTPFGTIYYKTHPLFNQDAVLRYNALFLDVGLMTYRYVDGRDTELLANRQENNADYRMDEWLTECGLQSAYPEANMYIQNVQDFVQ